MGRNKASIGELELAQAVAERESISDWKTVFKLTAIIAYAKHTAETVAGIFDVTPETVIRWAAAFKRRGVEGLRDKEKGHRPRRLNCKESEILKGWILSSRDSEGKLVHWTLKKLCLESMKVFGVEIGHSAMAEHLRRLEIVVKRPRPASYKFDQEKAEEFKKGRLPRRKTSCVKILTGS